MRITMSQPAAVMNRVGAAMMDVFIVSLVYGVLLGVLTGHYSAMLNRFNITTGNAAYDLLVAVALLAVYFIAVPFFWNGQTVGKRLTRQRLVSVDGARVGLDRLVLRFLLLLVPNMLLLGIPAIVMVYMLLFRQDKRGYHDLVARTKVEQV